MILTIHSFTSAPSELVGYIFFKTNSSQIYVSPHSSVLKLNLWVVHLLLYWHEITHRLRITTNCKTLSYWECEPFFSRMQIFIFTLPFPSDPDLTSMNSCFLRSCEIYFLGTTQLSYSRWSLICLCISLYFHVLLYWQGTTFRFRVTTSWEPLPLLFLS